MTGHFQVVILDDAIMSDYRKYNFIGASPSLIALNNSAKQYTGSLWVWMNE